MIGEKLKEIRESKGMNKKEFAQYLGLKYTTYNNYEIGSREPSSDFLILISEKFDISIDYLLGLNDQKEILHSYQLSAEEYDYIVQLRQLDDHDRQVVRNLMIELEKREELYTENLNAMQKRLLAYEKAFQKYKVSSEHADTF